MSRISTIMRFWALHHRLGEYMNAGNLKAQRRKIHTYSMCFRAQLLEWSGPRLFIRLVIKLFALFAPISEQKSLQYHARIGKKAEMQRILLVCLLLHEHYNQPKADTSRTVYHSNTPGVLASFLWCLLVFFSISLAADGVEEAGQSEKRFITDKWDKSSGESMCLSRRRVEAETFSMCRKIMRWTGQYFVATFPQ